jgi:hypothetical protein
MEKAVQAVLGFIVLVLAFIGAVSLFGSGSNTDHGYVGVIGQASVGLEYRGHPSGAGYVNTPAYRDNVPSWLHVRRE